MSKKANRYQVCVVNAAGGKTTFQPCGCWGELQNLVHLLRKERGWQPGSWVNPRPSVYFCPVGGKAGELLFVKVGG